MKIKQLLIKLGRKAGLLEKPQPDRFHFTRDILSGNAYSIGEYTYGVPKVYHWGEDARLVIGKFCSIAEHVTIFLGGNHRTDWKTTYPFSALTEQFPGASHIKGHPATKGDVVIGNDVWIGYGSIILSGVEIGDGAVVAAGAVVTKKIGPYEIWGGNPAKLIGKRFSDAQIASLQKEAWWNWPIDKILAQVETLCAPPSQAGE